MRRIARAVLPVAVLAVAAGGADARPATRAEHTETIVVLHPVDARQADALFGDDSATALARPRPSTGREDILSLVQGMGNPPVDAAATAAARRAAAARTARSAAARLPEPATWAMLILGFGAIGALVRRRLRRSEERFNDRIRRIAAGEEID